MSKLRVGVAGVGSIGINHARIYAALDQADLVCIYDPNPKAAEAAARKYRCGVASSLEEFAGAVQAASIAAPTSAHHEIGTALLSRGIHVLIEKPITANTAEAMELVDMARAKNAVLQVGHVERFNPVLEALEQRLTHPRFLEVTRLSQYPFRSLEIGVVLDLMIHDLEIILHLVRSPVTSIDAVGVAVLSKGEDIANVRLHFENGCVANVTASRISIEKMRKIRVFQEDAYLSLDYGHQTGEIYRLVDGRIVKEKVAIERDEPLLRELRHFVECAQLGRQPVVGGREAVAALDLAMEITRRIQAASPR